MPEDRKTAEREEFLRQFQAAPIEKKIGFLLHAASVEKNPAMRNKILSAADDYAEVQAQSRREAEERKKAVRGADALPGAETARPRYDSDALLRRALSDSVALRSAAKLEPFLRALLREGIEIPQESFEACAEALRYAMINLDAELVSTAVRRTSPGDARTIIDPFDANSADPAVVAFRRTLAELNARHFDDRPSPFRIRP